MDLDSPLAGILFSARSNRLRVWQLHRLNEGLFCLRNLVSLRRRWQRLVERFFHMNMTWQKLNFDIFWPEVLKTRTAQIARRSHMPGFVRYGHIYYCVDDSVSNPRDPQIIASSQQPQVNEWKGESIYLEYYGGQDRPHILVLHAYVQICKKNPLFFWFYNIMAVT